MSVQITASIKNTIEIYISVKFTRNFHDVFADFLDALTIITEFIGSTVTIFSAVLEEIESVGNLRVVINWQNGTTYHLMTS